MSWTTTRTVEFNHCDPAGIVFYPRYFEMISSVIEEFFARYVKYPFAPMHFDDHMGIPTAQINVKFAVPSRLGEILEFTIDFSKIGTSSAHLQMVCGCDGETRFTSDQVLVRMDLQSGKSNPWPENIADKLKSV